MPTQYTVTQGDCMSSIAAAYGFSDYRTIYDDPANADLKQQRPNPNVLAPGDVVTIPDRAPTSFSCATGQSHDFSIDLDPVVLRVDPQVATAHFYELTIGGDTFKGQTDGTSPIEQPISASARIGRLELWPATPGNEDQKAGAFSWEIRLGELDPVDEISGVQGRLANLGYYAGPIDGELGSELTLAVAAFETDQQLTVTGDPTDATLQTKLQTVHDGG